MAKANPKIGMKNQPEYEPDVIAEGDPAHADGPGVEGSEVAEVDYSFINVVAGGRTIEVAFPSDASKAAGVVACKNGHPNIPDPSSGKIACGCGSTEVAQ